MIQSRMTHLDSRSAIGESVTRNPRRHNKERKLLFCFVFRRLNES
jgi:hypothetical protein